MNSIEEVQADTANERLGPPVKDCEAVPFITLRVRRSPGDEFAALSD